MGDFEQLHRQRDNKYLHKKYFTVISIFHLFNMDQTTKWRQIDYYTNKKVFYFSRAKQELICDIKTDEAELKKNQERKANPCSQQCLKNSDHKQVFFWILSKGNHQLIEEILGSLIENLLTVYVLTANFLAPVFEIELMSVRSGVLKLSFLKVLKFDFQNSSQVDINIPFHTDWLSILGILYERFVTEKIMKKY